MNPGSSPGSSKSEGYMDGYQKCFEENARPDPVFRWCSKALAFSKEEKAMYDTSVQGLYFAV